MQKTSFWKSKRGILLLIIAALSLLDLCLITASFAKYVSVSQATINTSIAEFYIASQEWDTVDEELSQDSTAPVLLKSSVDNTKNQISGTITVTITVLGGAPLEHTLAYYSSVSPDNKIHLDYTSFESVLEGDVYTYTLPVGSEKIDFQLCISWKDDTYDERFGAMANYYTTNIRFDQAI